MLLRGAPLRGGTSVLLRAARRLCTPAAPPEKPTGFLDRLAKASESDAAKKFAAVCERGGSWAEAATESRAKQQEDQREQSFADFNKLLVSMPRFDMNHYRAELEKSERETRAM